MHQVIVTRFDVDIDPSWVAESVAPILNHRTCVVASANRRREKPGQLMASNESITRLERTWMVLVKLFEELARQGIQADASRLRDSKAFLHLVRTAPPDPCVGFDNAAGDPLVALEQSIEKAKIEMMSASLELGDARAKYWMEGISQAELDDSEEPMVYGESRFLPGLPKRPDEGWARLTLPQAIGEGRVQDVAEQFGVLVEFEDDLHLVFEGNPSLVKKALADVYYLSQP